MVAYFTLFVTEVFLALWMTQQWLTNHFQCILNRYFPQGWAIYVGSSHACAWKFLFCHVPMVLSSTHRWPITRIVMLISPKLAAFSPAANSGLQIWCCVSNWTYGNGISLAPFAHLRAFCSGPWALPFQGYVLWELESWQFPTKLSCSSHHLSKSRDPAIRELRQHGSNCLGCPELLDSEMGSI